MSTKANDELLERAAEMVDRWEGTLHAKLIRMALDSNDLDLVRQYTLDAEAEAAVEEMNARDVLPPEQLYERAEALRDELREKGISA